MSMMRSLTTQVDSQYMQCKPKTYQGKRRGQTRNIYDKHIYDQRNYHNRYRSNSGERRISFNGRIHMDRIIEIALGIIRTIEMILGEEICDQSKL